MNSTLGLLKLAAGCICLSCVIIHYTNLMEHEEERFPHAVIMCGTFVGLTALTFGLGLSSIIWKPMPMLAEMTFAFSASIVMFYNSLEAMVYAEEDEHLPFLTDMEERRHPYFFLSRWQSGFSLFGALWFAMNGVVCADIYFVTKTNPDDPNPACDPLELGNYCEPLFQRIAIPIGKVKATCSSKWTVVKEMFKRKPRKSTEKNDNVLV